MEKKREKEKLTILLDKSIKESFREHCDNNGLILGKQIEILIQKELEKIKGSAKK